jgi:hypothetical protein
MKVFDILTSETLIKSTNANHSITTTVNNQNSAAYDGLIEIQGRKSVVEHERLSRKGLYTQVAIHKKTISSSKIQDKTDEIRHLEQTALPEKVGKLDSIRNDLRAELNKKVSCVSELNKFRETNKLKHAAVYPEETNKIFGVLFLCMVLEAALNAFFLSKASEFGLAGGFAIAIGISLLNLLVAFFMSKCLRYFHHVEPKKNIIGTFVALLLTLSVGAISLFIGHYRSALDGDVGSASIQAVTNMNESLFGISTFDSWILVCITFAIFLFVTFKCYKSDDPYPGYGEISKKAKNAVDKYSRSKTKADDLINELRKQLVAELDVRYEELDQLVVSLDEDQEAIQQLGRDFRSFLTQQSLEFDTYCEECRQRFSHDCLGILDKSAVFSKAQESIIFEVLEPLLIEEDEERFSHLRNQIRSFRETQFADIRRSYLAATSKLVLDEEQVI